MPVQNRYIIKSIVVSLLATMLFSCSKNIEQVESLYKKNEDIPISETKNFKLTYTLMGNSVLILTAPTMTDFSNQIQFQYQSFPQKIKIEIINSERGEITIITADKGYIYRNPDFAELVGNVHIQGYDGGSLDTSHLFWDMNNNHIFGEEKTVLKQNDEKIEGYGFDSDMNFKNVRINEISGIMKIEQRKE